MLNALHVPQPVVLVLGGAIAAAVMKTLFPNSKDAPLQEPVCEGESVEETIDCLASKGVTL